MYIVSENLTMQDKMQEISVSGREFITPEIHRIAKHRNGIASGIKKLLATVNIAQVEELSHCVYCSNFLKILNSRFGVINQN